MVDKTAVFIGHATAVVQCGSIWLRRQHKISAIVSENKDVCRWAEKNSISCYENIKSFKDLSGTCDYDWLFSVANLDLVPDQVIARARDGAANFHDGPLPEHAGLNAPVWALLDGDVEYAINWHTLTSHIDAGDILVEKRFIISSEETALTLNSRCLESAVDAFEELVDAIEADRVEPRKQVDRPRCFHTRHAVPTAFGRLDFTSSSDQVARVVRALDHGPYRNPISVPKVDIGSAVFCASAAQEVPGEGPPGTVLAVGQTVLTVACQDGAVELRNLKTMDQSRFDPSKYLKVGDCIADLSKTEAQEIERVVKQAKSGDDVWREPLAMLSPVRIPGVGQTVEISGWEKHPRNVDADNLAELTLALAILSRQLDDKERIDIAACDATADRKAGYVSDWVPLGFRLDFQSTVQSTLANVTEPLKQISQFPVFTADLPLRDPEISQLSVPHIGLVIGGSVPVSGTALTVSVIDGSSNFYFDAHRIDRDFVDILVTRFEHLLQAISAMTGAEPLSEVPAMPESEENRILVEWNQTKRQNGATRAIHRFFEEQVERNPTAPALVHASKSLTYAEVNERANRIAHQLIELGVKPGVLVGLSTHRTHLLVVAALAILKAGGAYVPLDPAFPEERLGFYLSDSELDIVVTENALAERFKTFDVNVMSIDADPTSDVGPTNNPSVELDAEDLAYMIYTSGSTGRPKGVMISHGNVANFFAGMDDRLGVTKPCVWLAVTSISFDISVLELFWTLARGFKVVLNSPDGNVLTADSSSQNSRDVAFSLFFWGHNETGGEQAYDLLIEGSQFADTNGFEAVWIPERHFHEFGSQFPNPSVAAAAVAVLTRNINIRAGSCVAPLHHPARIAEEWAVVDNLSKGRVGIAIASGWQSDDFLLRPENRPPANKPAMFETINTLKRLWRGEAVSFPFGPDRTCEVVTHPRPVTKEIPLWLTTAGNPQTWRQAGENGMNILTHLLGQSIPEVAEKIEIYHQALRGAGYDVKDFGVTLMLHSYIAETREKAKQVTREPLKNYLRSSMNLVKEHMSSFPAFKRRGNGAAGPEVDPDALADDELEALLEHAYLRYFEKSGLFGSVEDGVARVEELRKIGVTEIACLVDIGIDIDHVREGLPRLADVLSKTLRDSQTTVDTTSAIAAAIDAHKVTHVQCTPSLMRMMLMNQNSRKALAGLDHILLGGEPLPDALVETLAQSPGVRLSNMYGPTEATIWSTMAELSPSEPVTLGTPISNTFIYILDQNGKTVPIGTLGEVWIGGAGVSKGYWKAEHLTAERFVPNPFGEGTIYKTGDMARWTASGALQFVGRIDDQIKLRGHRIELGEIEAAAMSHSKVNQVVARLEQVGNSEAKIALFLVASQGLNVADLRLHLSLTLPDYMIPNSYLFLDQMPLTPNGKIDRNALIYDTGESVRPVETPFVDPKDGLQKEIAEIWQQVLQISKVGANDDFFELGGDSLTALEASLLLQERLVGKAISMTDIFQTSTLAKLAKRLDLEENKLPGLEDFIGVSPVRPKSGTDNIR